MLDRETLDQLLDTIRRFVRERLVPNEERIAEVDAIRSGSTRARTASSNWSSPAP